MDNTANVTISRIQSSHEPNSFRISIGDESSGLNIVEVSMSHEQFANALTGIAHSKANYARKPKQSMIDNIGKKKETRSFNIAKHDIYDKDELKRYVIEQVNESGELKDGWMIWDDGTRSQQPTLMHKVILYRYV